MDELSIRVYEPETCLQELRATGRGTNLRIEISVLVSAQQVESIAQSAFDALFIGESLANALDRPVLSFAEDGKDPNCELVVVEGAIRSVADLISFFEEWDDQLDPDGSGEPFLLFDEPRQLQERVETSHSKQGFALPELVAWYREIARDAESESDD